MHVLAVLAQKGGVGKTTLTTSLAISAVLDGKSVAILDTDPQASACFWEDMREGDDIAVIPVPPSRIEAAIAALRQENVDLVIIDGAAISKDIVYSAAAVADFVLIPTRCSALDFKSMIDTVNVVKGIQKPLAVVLNFVEPKGPEVENATEVLDSIGVDLCPIFIGQRKPFYRTQGSGLTVLETEPGSKAAAEIRKLYTYTDAVLTKMGDLAA